MILLLPVGGLGLFRIYENQLIRNTEGELIAQAAVIRAMYESKLKEVGSEKDLATNGRPLSLPMLTYYQNRQADIFDPVFPELDLRETRVRPPPDDALPPIFKKDPLMAKAGEKLMPIIRNAQRTTLAGIRVVDTHGIVVATSRSELGLSIVHREEVAEVLMGLPVRVIQGKRVEKGATLSSISRSTSKRVVIGLPIVLGTRIYGAVLASRTPLDVSKDLYQRRRALITLFSVLAGILVVVAMTIGYFISRPLRNLVEHSQGIVAGNLPTLPEIQNPRTQEVAELSDAIRTMASTLQTRAEYIQSFARSVSHEFKTPLTSIGGAIEILLEHFDSMSSEERQKFLTIVKKESEHMDRLVSKLLQLAKADMVKPGTGRVRVKVLVDDVVGTTSHRNQNILVEVTDEALAHEVGIEREVLFTIVSNLIENAFQHGEANLVRLVGTIEGGRLVLAVEDNGRGISEANLAQVFDPFFTTAQDSGGTGMGLTISSALIKAHGGQISVSSSKDLGTKFLITI